MLLEDVLKEFLFDCRLRKLSERTIKTYRVNILNFLKYIEKEFNIIVLEDVMPPVIKAYVSYLTLKGNKESYINSILKAIKSFMNYCLEEDYIRRNPMDKIKFQKESIPIINTFTDNEVIKMIKYFKGTKFLDVRNKLIMILLFDTGMRNSEICNLKVTDICDSYILVNGKGNKQRAVPISPILNKQLIKYNRVRTAYIKNKFAYQKEYYLLSQKGKKLTIESIENIVRTCGKACNVRNEIRISPHTCRHYYAQAQLKNGCDLYTLSKLLGHTKIDITKIYLRSINDNDFLNLAVGTSPLMNL